MVMNLHLHKTVRIRLAITLFLLALVTGLSTMGNPALVGTGGAGTGAPYGAVGAGSSGASAPASAETVVRGQVRVGHDVKHDVSPPLRDIKPVPPLQGKAPDNEPATLSNP